MKRIASLVVPVCLFALTLQTSLQPLAADVKRGVIRTASQPRSASTKQVVLKRCRISLIDEVTLASERPGTISFVVPEEGDTVRAGQQVAGMRDDVARATARIAQVKAKNDVQIRYAKKSSQVAQVEHEKALQTNEDVIGAVPDIEIQQLRLAAEKTLLQIEQAQLELSVNGFVHDEKIADLKTFRVEAPFDGIVTRVYKRPGEAVRQGDPILEMASTQRVRVEGYIDLKHIWTVKPGAVVSVQLDIPGVDLSVEKEKFAGRIVFVDPAVQPVTRKARVWAEVVNRKEILRAGLQGTMTIDIDNKQSAPGRLVSDPKIRSIRGK